MFKNSSVKYYESKKEILQKSLVKSMEVFLKKKKAKSGNVSASNIKISLNMKYKGYLSIEKNII